MRAEQEERFPLLSMSELQKRREACQRAWDENNLEITRLQNPTPEVAVRLGTANFFYDILHDTFAGEIWGRQITGVLYQRELTNEPNLMATVIQSMGKGNLKPLKYWIDKTSYYALEEAHAFGDDESQLYTFHLKRFRALKLLSEKIPEHVNKPPQLPPFPWENKRFESR